MLLFLTFGKSMFFFSPINSQEYSFCIKMKSVFQERHNNPKHLQIWKIYRSFSKYSKYVQIAIQNFTAEILLQFHKALYPSKYFWIYYHLPLSCFTLQFLVSLLVCASHGALQWFVILPLPLSHSNYLSYLSLPFLLPLPFVSGFCQQPFYFFFFSHFEICIIMCSTDNLLSPIFSLFL